MIGRLKQVLQYWQVFRVKCTLSRFGFELIIVGIRDCSQPNLQPPGINLVRLLLSQQIMPKIKWDDGDYRDCTRRKPLDASDSKFVAVGKLDGSGTREEHVLEDVHPEKYWY